jgi:hypothetical protein
MQPASLSLTSRQFSIQPGIRPIAKIPVNIWNGIPESAHHNTAVGINVGVELSLDEVGIVQGGVLKPQRDLQQRVADLQPRKQLVASVFDNFCARIVVFVNANVRSQ